MHRLKRRLIALVLLAAVALGLARLALASDYACRETLARLEAAIGAPVKATSVRLGFSDSALSGLKVFEVAASAETPAWTAVGTVDADVSLWQLLTNDLGAGVVTLRDVAVTLAFDRDGRLVTRMPSPAESSGTMPLLRIEGGTFTLRRAGVSDETFHNIRLELRTEGERQVLSGSVEDPDWGRWSVTGGRERSSDPFTLVLKTVQPVHATMPMLRRAPFVPPGTWRAVECDGNTTCEVILRFNEERVHYRVDLSPVDTTVYVPCISLRAAGANGRVLIEDDILTLSNVRGGAGGGEIRLASTMDFRNPDFSVLRFGIGVSRINPRLVPESWGVPNWDGQLEGKADIELTLRDGYVVNTRGQGQGMVKMFPFLRPLSIYLEADGKGFRFGLGKN
jgi:hypothetical protein